MQRKIVSDRKLFRLESTKTIPGRCECDREQNAPHLQGKFVTTGRLRCFQKAKSKRNMENRKYVHLFLTSLCPFFST